MDFVDIYTYVHMFCTDTYRRTTCSLTMSLDFLTACLLYTYIIIYSLWDLVGSSRKGPNWIMHRWVGAHAHTTHTHENVWEGNDSFALEEYFSFCFKGQSLWWLCGI